MNAFHECARIIERDGWTRGLNHRKNRNKNTWSHCMMGALEIAVYQKSVPQLRAGRYDVNRSNVFSQLLGFADAYITKRRAINACTIPSYNDSVAKNKHEIIDMFNAIGDAWNVKHPPTTPTKKTTNLFVSDILAAAEKIDASV